MSRNRDKQHVTAFASLRFGSICLLPSTSIFCILDMLLYQDIITEDEMFSDAFPVYAACPSPQTFQLTTIQEDRRWHCLWGRLCHDLHQGQRCRYRFAHCWFSVYIRPINRHPGANPSAEEQDEALEDGAKTVNNIIYSFRLQPTVFDKKTYLSHLKACFLYSDLDVRRLDIIRDTWKKWRRSYKRKTRST